MAAVQDYMIYNILKNQGGRATRQQIFDALGDDEESRRAIKEKLTTMERFGIIAVEGDEVTIR